MCDFSFNAEKNIKTFHVKRRDIRLALEGKFASQSFAVDSNRAPVTNLSRCSSK